MPELIDRDYYGAFQRGKQNALSNRLGELRLSDAENQMTRQQQVRNTLADLPNVAPENRQNFLGQLQSQGGFDEASQIQQQWSSMTKEQRFEQEQKSRMVSGLLKGVSDGPSYEAARTEIARVAPKVAELLPLGWDERTAATVKAHTDRLDGLFSQSGQVPTSIQDRRDRLGRLPLDESGNLKPENQWTAEEKAAVIENKLAPPPVGSAIQTINERDTADDIADTEQTIAEGKEFGKLTGSSRAKAIDGADENIRGIETNIRNLDEAYQALADGAESGPIVSKWTPTIREETQRLENSRAKLGLDVVGATTFGALSKGELDIALAVALPNLPPPELMKWIRDRQTAQRKLIAYFDEQIEHLDSRGTVASFRRMKKKEARGAGKDFQSADGRGAGGSEDDQALQWAQQNPDDPRAQQILQLLGQ